MTEAPPAPDLWSDALLAAALFAIDPGGLTGIVIRSGPSPARDLWTSTLRALLPAELPMRRMPASIEDERLLGGLDLSASLAAGRPVAQRGLLAECDGGIVVLAMAERVDVGVAARIAAVLDRGEVVIERDGLAARLPARVGLVAFDEGATPEESPPAALLERFAFRLELEGLPARGLAESAVQASDIEAARRGLAAVAAPDAAVVEALCAMAQMFALASIRAPLLALRAASAHAALQGRARITTEDAVVAARLVLGAGASAAPPQDMAEPPAPPPPESSAEPPPDLPDDEASDPDAPPPSDADLVIEAIRAALPDDLLARVTLEGAARARSAGARGSGAPAKSARRGRPTGSRSGALRPGDRLNLVETLRAATPWQKLRGGGLESGRIQVRQADFRIRRFVQPREGVTIFVVDASGSAALQRLAEAKGAVELLLAKAYVSRARVALIAFRGVQAEILLPPTRSLTRAKRQLAGLPGGGGTPLAAGMDAALMLALAEKSRDRTPLIVFLTDGRANIGRDGSPGRAQAEIDALASARQVQAAGIASIFVDTSARPQPGGDRFAKAMGGVYAPLPYVDAQAMFGVIDNLQAKGRAA